MHKSAKLAKSMQSFKERVRTSPRPTATKGAKESGSQLAPDIGARPAAVTKPSLVSSPDIMRHDVRPKNQPKTDQKPKQLLTRASKINNKSKGTKTATTKKVFTGKSEQSSEDSYYSYDFEEDISYGGEEEDKDAGKKRKEGNFKAEMNLRGSQRESFSKPESETLVEAKETKERVPSMKGGANGRNIRGGSAAREEEDVAYFAEEDFEEPEDGQKKQRQESKGEEEAPLAFLSPLSSFSAVKKAGGVSQSGAVLQGGGYEESQTRTSIQSVSRSSSASGSEANQRGGNGRETELKRQGKEKGGREEKEEEYYFSEEAYEESEVQ